MRNILTIYSFPGKLLAELWFLWSKKGQLWGSARRRHHPFVHFFYATVMYSIAALIITAALSEKMPRDQHQAFASEVSSETPSNSSAEIELASPIEENDAEEPDQNEVLAEVDDAKSENKSRSEEHTSELQSLMRNSYGHPLSLHACLPICPSSIFSMRRSCIASPR